jgi:HAMP domain-containing protein
VIRRISLRALLLVPLVLQLAVTAGLISLVSYQGRQWAANDLASRSQQRASRQVADYLSTYLRTPQQVIALMADAVASGQLDPNDRAAVTQQLWFLHRLFPDAPYLNFGWANGDFIGLGQTDNASREVFLEVAQAASIQRLEQIRLNGSGQPAGLERTKPFADFRSDGWYREPLEAGRAVWTPIYNWVDAPEVMAMGAGMPIRRQGQVIGVAGVDVFLSNICHFLSGLPISRSGEIYIVESNGTLVADTSGRLPFAIVGGRGIRQRAQDSANPMIRGTARALAQGHGGFQALSRPQQLRVGLSRGEALVRIDPYRDAQGLDWRIVVVIPEEDVYGNLRQEALSQLGFSLVAILISGAIALLVVEFVIRRLDRLVQSSDAMVDGDLSQNVELGSIQEMARLAASFNGMAERLRRSFSTLRARNREILRLADQLRDALTLSEQQLQRETRQRLQLEQSKRAAEAPADQALLADPGTGLLSRRGLMRRLDGLTAPITLVQLACSRLCSEAELQGIADRLEALAAQHQGCAGHDGQAGFTLVLAGLEQVQAERLLMGLLQELEPLPVCAGLASLAVADDDLQARRALPDRADQALEAARAAGMAWSIAP